MSHRPETGTVPFIPRFVLSFFSLAPLFTGAASGLPCQDQPPEPPTVDDVMLRLLEKFKNRDKKYRQLAEAVDGAVKEALEEAVWFSGPGNGSERRLGEHPHFVLVDELGRQALAADGQRKNSEETQMLLAQFPWSSQLELLLGLAQGSDREVPSHKVGFIDLGEAPTPIPGYPELVTNHYLYGLREVVGWQYGVKPGKRPRYEEREPKDRPRMQTELPAWERLRVYLHGSVPEVPLYAIPFLTHQIHSQLVERRRSASGELSRMDRFLTLLDSKWNGFYFEAPYQKDPVIFVEPVHNLFTDNKGFVYRFGPAQRLASVGDIPFVSLPTYQEYAQHFRGETVGLGDFITRTPEANEVTAQFSRESAYLSRYKVLIDLIVRAVLCPHLPYPAYLQAFDYPEGRMPDKRKWDFTFDVSRKHALTLWAYVGKDPVALADFLHDELLAKNGNRFPLDVALPVQFTQLMRDMEEELLTAIAERAAKDSEFEREFSPHATYRERGEAPVSDFLMHSFHSFHTPPTDVVREAALAVILGELDG